MNAIAEIKRLPSSMKEVNSMIDSMLTEMEAMNEYQRAEVMVILNLFERVQKGVKESEMVRNTMTRIANERVEINGYRIEPHSAVSYEYNDPIYLEMKEKIKQREGLMKAAMSSTIYDEDGIEIPPAIKKTTESYKLTLKK
jgi:wyosine [tRNA(Phe)-imidazoG37] synthetase (radical SAM superfamily)